MANAAEFVRSLCQSGAVRLDWSDWLEAPPARYDRTIDCERAEGMMLGLAIGDALGNTSESMLPDRRRSVHGIIRDYLPNRYADNRRVGLPSDDTQLAVWTLEHLLEYGRIEPEALADLFASRQIFGSGHAVREFVENRRQGLPWPECGAHSAGNGALMRIAPVLLPHLLTGTEALWTDTLLAAAVTHNEPGSLAACAAFVNMLWELLHAAGPPKPEWWMDQYVAVASQLEGDTHYQPRNLDGADYDGTLWEFARERVPEAYRQGLSVLEACNSWYSGAFLLETVPCVLYILMLHGHDPEEAIIRAVNDTRDNDTIAAIVGAAVGALHGAAALPPGWKDNLLGRTAADDDGRLFELLAQAKRRWGDKTSYFEGDAQNGE